MLRCQWLPPKVFDRELIARRLARRPGPTISSRALVLADLAERLAAVTRSFEQALIMAPDARQPAASGAQRQRRLRASSGSRRCVGSDGIPLVDPEDLDLPRRRLRPHRLAPRPGGGQRRAGLPRPRPRAPPGRRPVPRRGARRRHADRTAAGVPRGRRDDPRRRLRAGRAVHPAVAKPAACCSAPDSRCRCATSRPTSCATARRWR